jgi:hypothetical protein
MKKSLRIFFILWGTIILFFGYEAIGNFNVPASSKMAQAASSADKSENSGPGKGQLYVYVKPTGADIKLLNINEKFNQGIQLKPGQYRLGISAREHTTERYTVKIVAGQVTTIKIFLPVGDNTQDIYKKKVGFEDIYRMSGVSIPSNKNKGTLSKQEAFIAAFAVALGNCSDLLPFSKIDDLMYQFTNLKTGDLVYHSNYFDYSFVEKKKLIQKSYLFRFVYYKNKRIFKFIEPFMKSPEITIGEFPSWHDLPFSISGINIVDIAFSSDSDDVIPVPEGGAKVSIEVPITTLELIKYQKQDWEHVYKNNSYNEMMIWKELQKELDKVDFTYERDDAKSPK